MLFRDITTSQTLGLNRVFRVVYNPSSFSQLEHREYSSAQKARRLAAMCAHKLKQNNRGKEWRVLNQSFKVDHGPSSLMMRWNNAICIHSNFGFSLKSPCNPPVNRIAPLGLLPWEIRSLSTGKAICDRVALPNLRCMLDVYVFA